MPTPANLPESLSTLIDEGRLPRSRVLVMLALRSVLTFSFLLGLAAVFSLSGSDDSITKSASWWLWFVTVTNLVCLFLMYRFARQEGLRLTDIYFFNRATWKGDLRWTLIALVGIAVFAIAPGALLSQALWGDPTFPNAMLIKPLPPAAVYPLFLLMPASQALAELPVYWGYVAPRLRAFGLNRLAVILIVGTVLSLQHLFFAFQLDWKYDLWLALKYLPFAYWTGVIVDRRPTALPYLMVIHFLLDATLPYLVFIA